MPSNVAEQFSQFGLMLVLLAVLFLAWLCYLSLLKTYKNRIAGYCFDVAIVVVIFCYILGFRIFL